MGCGTARGLPPGAVEASQALAELFLRAATRQPPRKASAVGLQIERYHDPLWRLLIESRDRAGDHGAATKARHGYDRMLAELGIRQEKVGLATPRYKFDLAHPDQVLTALAVGG